MSLSFQVAGRSSLSPGSGRPPGVPRRTSARRNRATVGAAEVLVIVTLVTRAPPAPRGREVTARARTAAAGSEFSARRLAYDDITACGLPRVFGQLGTSGWVDSQ